MVGMIIGFYWVAIWSEKVFQFSFPLSLLFLVAFAFCFAQLFGLIAFGFQWIRNHTCFSSVFLFPVVLLTVFNFFPLLFNFRLGDSQWLFPLVLQPIDITGVSGLDFVMAVSNVLFFALLKDRLSVFQKRSTYIAVLILVFWFGLGAFKLAQWDQKIANWPIKKIGLVQPNRQPTLSRPLPEKGHSRLYPIEMEIGDHLIDKKPDLMVWPEGHFFGYTFWNKVRSEFTLKVRKWDVPLVFYDATRRKQGEEEKAFNSIMFLNRNGHLVDQYDKMKLIPFAEYTPIFNQIPLLHWILGDYLDNLTPGKKTKVINLAGMRLVPKTCYEPLFPDFVAETIRSDGKGKVILVQSQDGWFGESSQPFQHMAVVVIRAVENRVPIIHVIQNGPSGVILPNGRPGFLSEPFVRGGWVAEMPYHAKSGGSFYSRYPKLFKILVWIAFLISVLMAVFKKIQTLKN